ncbi:hypothetical protein DH2020_031600 [Rehmannia glutinosa]|uniref:Uncharacterized protein n=1 Tax=Rehmannia glutinosa TaxID=99300 RepID=A0ABR0VHK5_REHGL
MSSQSGKGKPELGLSSLSDRLRNALTYEEEDNGVNVNKPDFRELDLGSPVSPLRTRNGGGHTATTTTTTTTSSSSSSSGSISGRNSAGPNPNLPRKSDSNPNSHSGELSAESSPSAVRSFKPGHTRSDSAGSHPPIYSASGSATSPAVNVLPTGNICPSGRILKTGMASRSTKTDVLGSGSVNYGHGSIMRGGLASKPGLDSGPTNHPRGLMVGGDPGKRTGVCSGGDPEELKRMGNDNYKKGNFAEALSLYDKAIALSPGNAAYHFNRAAALIGLRRLVEAARECEEAIRLDPGYVRAHHRLGSLLLSYYLVQLGFVCHDGFDSLYLVVNSHRMGDDAGVLGCSLGQIENARKHICFPGHQPDPTEVQKLQNVEKHLSKCTDARRVGDWRSTLREVDAAIASGADASPQFPFPVEDIWDASRSIPLLRWWAVRARGNDLFKSERFTEACSAYGEGLRLDPSNSVLYCNRAACWFKLSQWERSVDDCNQALRIQPGYMKALLRRAASNCKLERWSEAVRDYEVLRRELPDNNEVAESLFHAQVALKKSREKSWEIMQLHLWSISKRVDIEESTAIAHTEKVRIVPTFKIYRKGIRVKEMICPSPEVLESSVRHYSNIDH